MAKMRQDDGVDVFSKKTINCLTKAGWKSTRKVEVEKYRVAFAEENLQLPSKVEAFLARFGGLVVQFKRGENQEDTLDFLADEAVQGLGDGALHLYEAAVCGNKLSPVGHFGYGACLLMMSSSGEVYGGSDWKLVYAGQSGPHAIENIISGNNLEVIADESVLRSVEE